MIIDKENQQNLMISVMNSNGKESLQKEPTSYMNNMLLPDMVKATRNQPLGPDCIIATAEVTDQTVLKTVDFYWYISHEKGCVECAVKPLIPNTSFIKSEVVASDPRCVITRKHRRFEAYCCMICRANFVTVVQALLHLKALHRRHNHILIQDKDVFQNIDKAMEVPPVPLPWHIARRTIAEEELNVQSTTEAPTFVLPPGSMVVNSSINADVITTPANLDFVDQTSEHSSKSETKISINATNQSDQINEATNEATNSELQDFQSPIISIILALKEVYDKKIKGLTFDTDSSQVLVKYEDGHKIMAKTPDLAEKNHLDSNELIDINETLSFTAIKEEKDPNSVTLKANNSALARKLFKKTKSADGEYNQGDISFPRKKIETLNENDRIETNSPSVSSESHLVAKALNRPLKSVRFMLGAPDSSDDERPLTPRKSISPISNATDNGIPEARETDFKGLQTVVADLITTASKGRITALPPTPPLTTSLATLASTPGIHTTGSSPNISKLVSNKSNENETPISRVQSWSSGNTGGTAFSVASMRRPYIARGFTYAEKIELMKQKNDFDSDFTTNHILKTAVTTPSITKTKTTKFTMSGQSVTKTMPSNKKRVRKSKYSTDPSMTLPVQSGIDNLSFNSLSTTKDASPPADIDSILSSTVKHFHENNKEESYDSDEGPPTLLTSLGATAAAYSSLLQQGILSANNFPSSDYYGSGEWASAAMDTLKRLQEENIGSLRTNNEATNNGGQLIIKQENVGDFFNDNHLSEDKRSLSDDTSTSNPGQLKVNFSRKRAKAKEHQRASSASPTKRRKDDAEVDHRDDDVTASMAWPVARYKDEPRALKSNRLDLLRSSLGTKCSSEPDLVARIKQESTTASDKREPVAAKPGDSLVFLDDVTMSSFLNHDAVMMRLQRSQPNMFKEKSDLSNPASAFSNMPEIFRNCIDTHFRVQLVRKMHVCKVCGYSVDAPAANDGGSDVMNDDVSMDNALRDHVMEHSLKELYEVGYNMASSW